MGNELDTVPGRQRLDLPHLSLIPPHRVMSGCTTAGPMAVMNGSNSARVDRPSPPATLVGIDSASRLSPTGSSGEIGSSIQAEIELGKLVGAVIGGM